MSEQQENNYFKFCKMQRYIDGKIINFKILGYVLSSSIEISEVG